MPVPMLMPPPLPLATLRLTVVPMSVTSPLSALMPPPCKAMLSLTVHLVSRRSASSAWMAPPLTAPEPALRRVRPENCPLNVADEVKQPVQPAAIQEGLARAFPLRVRLSLTSKSPLALQVLARAGKGDPVDTGLQNDGVGPRLVIGEGDGLAERQLAVGVVDHVEPGGDPDGRRQSILQALQLWPERAASWPRRLVGPPVQKSIAEHAFAFLRSRLAA